MTVAELIEELQKLNPTLDVYTEYWDSGDGCCSGSTETQEVSYVSQSCIDGPYKMQPGPRGGKPALRKTLIDVAVIHP